MNFFDTLTDKGLLDEQEAYQLDQAWEYARHLSNEGDELTIEQIRQLASDYLLLFSILEDTENHIITMEDDHKAYKEAVYDNMRR
ncbi:hypothetical protein CVR96_26675 [Salmonella enterica subsp. enterica serovar Typhimurium]|uniref:hypothetical protein n=4 Tax=Salmonella enterica TaxID=28901 RepID=UPI000C21C06B|nr:hypothetical protein [Salmonella enterica]PJH69370.1 hypothetical protein CVR96_26675 [Salmonella enterica subsp. enterica serovar Typhimurium]